MKKYFLVLMTMCLSVMVMAQKVWTVQSVPNTRIESNSIHVSDPDGFISDSMEMVINTALCAIREKADVFVVTLASIGDADPKHFATTLFNSWGIGDAETNNGVLLLFVEDQHALETETGYGAEETLTDAKCERIFTTAMAPYFRTGDYEGGLCAGVGEIVSVFGGEVPMGLKTTLPESSYYEDDGGDSDFDDMSILAILFVLFLVPLPLLGIIFWAVKYKTKVPGVDTTLEDGVTYVDGFKTSWTGSPWEGKGCLGGLMLGFSIFVILSIVIVAVTIFFPDLDADSKRYFNWITIVTLFLYLTWICFRHNHRVLKMAEKLSAVSISPKSVYTAAINHTANKIAIWMAPWLGWIYYLLLKKKEKTSNDYCCPSCGKKTRKSSAYALPEIHAVEERVEALKFTSFCCPNGHVVVVKEHGNKYFRFSTCKKCGGYTLKHVDTQTIRKADFYNSGEKVETYTCQHCGDTITKTVFIPMLVHHTSSGGSGSSYSSSSHSSYHSSSHSSSHSRGSFGGGRSGGGGHSGRW